MATKISISPLTRIEGHLSIHTNAEADPDPGQGGHRLTDAKCEGEMFRGFEKILQGRDPLDAQQITQRICGVCPIAHGITSVQCLENTFGVQPVNNGRLLQNLILSANYIQSHILHFYHLAALDFVDVKSVLKYKGNDRTLRDLRDWVLDALKRNDIFPAAPFLPRYEVDQYVKADTANWGLLGSYVKALEMRAIAHEMAAVFGAKLPHSTALVPTGCTQIPNIERVLSYRTRLDKLITFTKETYLPDLFLAASAFPHYWNIGKGYNNFLSYGVFRMENKTGPDINKFINAGAVIDGKYEPLNPDDITEDVSNSRYSSRSGLHPKNGETTPNPQNGYSWLKSPRYKGNPMEVGPLARVMVNYLGGNSLIKQEVGKVLASANIGVEKMNSVIGRHLARGLETLWLAEQSYKWLSEIELDAPAAKDFEIPEKSSGFGLTEAPRGALGHWMEIEDYKIKNYQCVVPTTWNCSPRDDRRQPGPVEKALEETPVEDPNQPIEAGRVVRSFDPCIACAVH